MRISAGAVEFITIGLSMAVALWGARKLLHSSPSRGEGRRRMPGAAVAALGILGLLAAAFLFSRPPTLSGENWYERTPYLQLALFVLMVFGMFASYLSRQIEHRRSIIEQRRKAGDASRPPLEFDAWELTAPMLVSVVTFGAVLEQIDEPSLGFTNIVLAFQTGFFWQTVLSRRSAS